jgi:hypothetical protein
MGGNPIRLVGAAVGNRLRSWSRMNLNMIGQVFYPVDQVLSRNVSGSDWIVDHVGARKNLFQLARRRQDSKTTKSAGKFHDQGDNVKKNIAN